MPYTRNIASKHLYHLASGFSISSQFCRYTIISHAFSIILRHCSSHHTLLAILLDLTISYNQASESRALLRHLLERSLQPSALPGTSTCDITTLDIGHAAHSRYLTNLLDTCCPTTGGVMNARTFTQILGEVICSFSVDHGAQAWTVKATVHLARSLRSMDYSAFLSMCSSVGHFLASHIESSKYNGAIPTHLDPVTSRFGKWLSHACQHLHGISAQPPNVEATEEIGIISDILVRANISGLHRLSGSEDARVLSDAVACLSTMALAPSVAGLLSQPALSSLDSILRAAPVKAESFGILVDVTMPQPSKLGGGSSTLDSIVFAHSTISALERWACVLRGHAYHLLEASLWSSALVHVEHLTPEMGSHYNPAAHHSALIAELGRLRHEIVQRVEAAERRCFTYGRGGSGQAASAQTLRKDTLARDQWRWEDMVGCWVQKTPVRTAGSKRRRDAVEDAQISAKQQQRRRKEERLAAWSAPRNTSPDSDGRRSSVRVRADSIAFDDCTTAARRSGSLTAPHPRSSVAPSSTSTSVDSSRLSTPQDDENRSSSARAAREKAAPSRRLSSFVTILRDAQMNRVVLHADSSDDEGAWLRDTHEPKMRAPIVRSEVCQDEDDADLVDARAMENQPSSDDVLDLFAYRPSEW